MEPGEAAGPTVGVVKDEDPGRSSGLDRGGSSVRRRAYLEAFFIALILCWSPSNAAAYLAPGAAVCWILIRTWSGWVFLASVAFLTGQLLLVFLHWMARPDYLLQSGWLWVFTHSSFLVLVAVRPRWLTGEALLRSMAGLVAAMTLLQGSWGLVQAAYGFSTTGLWDLASGDLVEGTIHPALAPELSFSNVMFASNMAFMLLFMTPSVVVERRYRTAFVIGALSLLLASVVHILVFLAVCVGVATIVFQPRVHRWRTRIALVLFVVAVPAAAWTVMPTNMRLIGRYYVAFIAGESPKREIVDRALMEMPDRYALLPVTGLGPGQFSSRAGMIGTGQYFGGPGSGRSIPGLVTASSDPQREFFMDLWMEASDNPAYGSTQAPHFSWLSIYTELGAGALVLIIGFASLVLWRARSGVAENRLAAWRAWAFGAGTILLLLLGLQENYWEVPQAILVGLMLLQVLYASSTGPREHPA